MKHVLLIWAIILNALFASAQPSFNCFTPDSISASYQTDALANAVLQTERQQDHWKDSLHINPTLTQQFVGAIMAVRNQPTLAYWDEVFGDNPIHAMVLLNSIYLQTDTLQSFARDLYHFQSFDVHPYLDSVARLFGFELKSRFQSKYSNAYEFYITTQTPINTFAFERQLIALFGFLKVPHGNLCIACDEELHIRLNSNNEAQLIFNRGSVDCPAGCIYWDSYEYIVKPNCQVSDPTYRNWHFTEIATNQPKEKLNLYPVPTSQVLWLNSTAVFNYEITDLTGRKILIGKTEAGAPISVEDLSMGAYHLHLFSDAGIDVFKFQKQ